MSTDFACGVSQPSNASQVAKQWVVVNSAKLLPQANKRRRSHEHSEWADFSDMKEAAWQSQDIMNLDDYKPPYDSFGSFSAGRAQLKALHAICIEHPTPDVIVPSKLTRLHSFPVDAIWYDSVDEHSLNRIRLLSRHVGGGLRDAMPLHLNISHVIMSPMFSFTVSGIAATVSTVLLATGNYWPLMSFGVGAVAFAFLGILKLKIDRAVASGLPK